ncbi:hypothetical protein [Methylobacterium sp. WL6]|uniref:hypothetical protein n=1 Tax=Methylobacterium sp. WL6 TaxID=2603901 RepID=UPI00164F3928|nr:hypothetical protein [Methylobacterium sp. WL6]
MPETRTGRAARLLPKPIWSALKAGSASVAVIDREGMVLGIVANSTAARTFLREGAR